MKALWPVVAFMLFALIAASCEVQPAELNFRCKLDGRPKGCQVMVFNDAGAQVQEIPSEMSGIGYIKDLKPGKYTLKFKDVQGNMYPAVREVTLVPGDLQTIDVELNEGPGGGGDTATEGKQTEGES